MFRRVLETTDYSPALDAIEWRRNFALGVLRACANAGLVALFSLTLFLSSSLLALIEPMFAKMVLPLLGGTPAVWNTCLVFFQAVLLAGYAYGYWSIKWLRIRRQAMLHIIVLLVPLLVLPIALPKGWIPPANANPVAWLLLLLTAAMGLPFFAVSTSAPVLQRWFSATSHRAAADPYFLYAASNLGSMLALLAYPIAVEPFFRLGHQTVIWTGGYLVLVVLSFACMLCVRSDVALPSQKVSTAISPVRRLRWILLAFIPSSQLLGVTTFITSDIAAVPLFWIIPLSLYFLSFILVFSSRPIIPHRVMVKTLPALMLLLALFMMGRAAQPVALVLAVHLLALFVSAMVCHGELAKDRPPADRLTDFYLMLSTGGVCGGLFNALLAPLVFSTTAEYPIALVLACLVCPGRRGKSQDGSAGAVAVDLLLPVMIGLLAWGVPRGFTAWGITSIQVRMLGLAIPALLALGTINRPRRFAAAMAAMLLVSALGTDRGNLLEVHRSFFGIHRIVRPTQGAFNLLYHGTTIHGSQHIAPSDQAPTDPRQALTYYYRSGPLGELLTEPGLLHSARRIDVVGLGVGSIAAYAGAGTQLTYFEIDPVVRWVAEDSGYFSFLSAARARGADVQIVLGDARLTLRNAPDHACDLLVVDAFSGDAVPVHLLTRQAMRIYQSKLAEHGLVAFHVSNMYLDLLQVTSALAADGGWSSLYRNDLKLTPAEAADGKLASQWVVMSRSPQDLAALARDARWHPLPAATCGVWTDDFSNILGVFHWRGE